jgi:hypothetical protein
MSEQRTTSVFLQQYPSQCPHPGAVGERWGDPINDVRKAELQGYLGRWAAETDARRVPRTRPDVLGFCSAHLALSLRRGNRRSKSAWHGSGRQGQVAAMCWAHMPPRGVAAQTASDGGANSLDKGYTPRPGLGVFRRPI